MALTSLERITAEQLTRAAANVALPRTVRELLIQAAQTIQEMDKDIAVLDANREYLEAFIDRYASVSLDHAH